MLPKKTKYAIKALKELAYNYKEQKPVRISQLAENNNISRKFLEAILLELRHLGYVGSKLGVNGGYYLTKPPKEIFLSNIIRATGGPLALVPCVSLNFYEKCEECVSEDACSLRDVMLQVRIATVGILSKTSLQDLIKKENKQKQKPKKA